MGKSKKCCQKFLKKNKACKDCPLLAGLGKKAAKKRIKTLRQKLTA